MASMQGFLLRGVLVFVVVTAESDGAATHPVPRVAIIGGGINGGSAAYFLRQAMGMSVDITVYEAQDECGGRTMTRNFANVTIDVGGTAIFSQNQYMCHFVKSFDLQPQDALSGVSSNLGVWDGRTMRIEVNTESALATGFKLIARYGLSPRHILPAVRSAVSNFGKIYELQAENRTFVTPERLLEALAVFNLTQVSAYNFFTSLGVNDAFIKEVVDGASRDNYNQPGTMNSFADLISLAGAGVGGHVFTLANGTQTIAKRLSQFATRVHLKESVMRIDSSRSGRQYVVHSTARDNGNRTVRTVRDNGNRWYGSIRTDQFDGVIIATPLELTKIALPSDAHGSTGRGRQYQTTHVTFVHGVVNRSYFAPGRYFGSAAIPGEVLTSEDSISSFSSFGVHRVFADGSMVVKLFSRQKLTDSDLYSIFPTIYEVYRHVWKAYPKLQPLPSESWSRFVLDKGGRLLYTSGLETGASAMEVAAIAGRNGALLMQQALSQPAALDEELVI